MTYELTTMKERKYELKIQYIMKQMIYDNSYHVLYNKFNQTNEKSK